MGIKRLVARLCGLDSTFINSDCEIYDVSFLVMSDLNPIEIRRLETLFDMSGGYVLDFSNRTFEEFVYSSTKRRIYGDEFSNGSGSKAQRLRAFWKTQSNALNGKLLLDLCDYYQAFKFDANKQALYEQCRRIGERLLGQGQTKSKVEPSYVVSEVSRSPELSKDKAREFKSLLEKYIEMSNDEDHHKRGYVLQDILNKTFKAAGVATTQSFTRNDGGEQIDGAFKFDAWHYLAECRWRERLPDIRQLDGLSGQVTRTGHQTMGLFLSIEGWSPYVPGLLKQNPNKRIILMEGYDLYCVLSQQIELQELLFHKLAALNLEAEPFLSCTAIFTKLRTSSDS